MARFSGSGMVAGVNIGDVLTASTNATSNTALNTKAKNLLIKDNVVNSTSTYSSTKVEQIASGLMDAVTFKTINNTEITGNGTFEFPVSSGGNVSLKGLTSGYVNTSITYEITNFDSYSVYTATIMNGTVSIGTGTVTVNLNGVSGNNTLTVTRDGIENDFVINVLPVGINTPSITSPTNLSTNQSRYPTVTATGFSGIGPSQTHTSTTVQIATDSNFTNLIVNTTKNSGTLTEVAVTTQLASNTQYYVRMKYTSNLAVSSWSNTVGFITITGVGNWVAKLGGGNHDFFQSVTTDSSGNYIAVGNENSSTGLYEALIVKFDTSGNLLWQKRLGGSGSDYFYSVATDSSGNYIAVGYENSSNGTDEALIVKFDTSGNLLWQKRLGGTNNDYFYSVATDSSGNYIAVGNENSSTGKTDALIAKFDTNGNLLWQKRLGGAGAYYFNSVTTDSSGNYIAVGNESSSEALIAKFDTSGNLLWQKRLGGTNYDLFYSVTTDSSGNYIAVGNENSSNGTVEALIAKFDTSGNLLWQKRLGGSGADYFQSVTTDSSGNYIAVGYESSTGNYEALIAKFDTSGNLLWQKRLGGASSSDYFQSVTTDSSGNYIAVGYEYSSAGNAEALIAKFDTNGTIVTGSLSGIPQLSLNNNVLTLNSNSLTLNTSALTLNTNTLTLNTTALTLNTNALTFTKSTY